jgi:hypothetical protein
MVWLFLAGSGRWAIAGCLIGSAHSRVALTGTASRDLGCHRPARTAALAGTEGIACLRLGADTPCPVFGGCPAQGRGSRSDRTRSLVMTARLRARAASWRGGARCRIRGASGRSRGVAVARSGLGVTRARRRGADRWCVECRVGAGGAMTFSGARRSAGDPVWGVRVVAAVVPAVGSSLSSADAPTSGPGDPQPLQESQNFHE